MPLQEFYSCTWYDWGLWVERINEIEGKRSNDYDFIKSIVRLAMTQYYNWNRGNQAPIDPEDLWKFSFDEARASSEPSREDKIKAITEVAEKVKRRKKRG